MKKKRCQEGIIQMVNSFLKYEKNPVLGGKELGTCFDAYVWRDNGKLRMDFSWRKESATAVSFSDDGINWSEPIITLYPNKDSGWENRINRNCVIKIDEIYKMYYTGQNDMFSYIGIAESFDGIHFKRLQEEPILVPEFHYEGCSVMNPCVLYENGVYKMWYSSGETYEPNYICYAESRDGVHFSKHKTNPILMKNWKNHFEKDRLGGCQVIHTEDMGYLMFYIGYEDIRTARICVARSKNGITDWKRSPLNPVIAPTLNEWDGDATYKPSVIWLEKPNEWRVYYNGRSNDDEYIGFAKFPHRDLFPNKKLKAYVDKFNSNDEETVVQTIPNEKAYRFLQDNAPCLECPDEVIEETFAFRSWTIRKHLKNTEDGLMMTEFLPKVPWSGRHNTINAALFHHLNEYRWFANARKLNDYLLFFLENKDGRAYNYTTPALTAMYEFLCVTGNENLITENADKFENYFKEWESRHLTDSGLYWSFDDNDAMEWSISGSTPQPDGKRKHDEWIENGYVDGITSKVLKGLRPTMNAYMYGDAVTLSKIFKLVGNDEKSELYENKAKKIKTLVDEKLWDGDFYKAIHTDNINSDVSYKDIHPEMNVRELIGYNPWIYCMPDAAKASMFKYLKDDKCFKANTGFATADMSHQRFLYDMPHECLWNGYVWPFATSQTISGIISLLNGYEQSVITNNDLYDFIRTYADMHYVVDEKGKHSFIDEVMYPDKLVWSSREKLKALGWRADKGGYERGKDYNHSTFIDLVLRGLIGIDITSQTLVVKPRIVGIWKWFKVENLSYKNVIYNIYYDEDGTKYGKGRGIVIERV